MPLTLLVISPRVAPGLMTAQAWQVLAEADAVLCSDPTLPVARAVAATGRRVEAAPVPTGAVLLARAEREHVVWLASDEETDRLPRELATALVGAERRLPEVEVLHASYDVPGARLLDLVTVMDRLRADCPWDREQTHRSLARYLLEESYEALEAIESGDPAHLREELGDLLLQVLFHARIAAESGSEEGGFTIDDVAGGIVDKLVYRHPHVFGDVEVADSAEVHRNWEALKAAEKQRSSPLEGIPTALPALTLAEKVLGRLGRGDPPAPDPAGDPAERVGAELLAMVARARTEGVDAEQALREAVRRLSG